jgi:hypothetical protein
MKIRKEWIKSNVDKLMLDQKIYEWNVVDIVDNYLIEVKR